MSKKSLIFGNYMIKPLEIGNFQEVLLLFVTFFAFILYCFVAIYLHIFTYVFMQLSLLLEIDAILLNCITSNALF